MYYEFQGASPPFLVWLGNIFYPDLRANLKSKTSYSFVKFKNKFLHLETNGFNSFVL